MRKEAFATRGPMKAWLFFKHLCWRKARKKEDELAFELEYICFLQWHLPFFSSRDAVLAYVLSLFTVVFNLLLLVAHFTPQV
jgi:hypothetical protein